MVDITVRRVVITIPEAVAALLGKLRWRRAPRVATAQTAQRLHAAKQRASVARTSMSVQSPSVARTSTSVQNPPPPVQTGADGQRLGGTPKPQTASASEPRLGGTPKPPPVPASEPRLGGTPKPPPAPPDKPESQDTLNRLLKAKQRTSKG
jgi:hypothetical protein